MSTAPIPAYPIVYVDVASDGSAHVNVAGRHEHFDPAPGDVTRRAVTAYAAAVAAELHRPVRTRITDPDGQWLVAVHPTGTVTDLAEAPRKQLDPAGRRSPFPPRKPRSVPLPARSTRRRRSIGPPRALPHRPRPRPYRSPWRHSTPSWTTPASLNDRRSIRGRPPPSDSAQVTSLTSLAPR